MATIVDSLIITLGLDPTGVEEGKKQVLNDLVELKQQANKTGKDMENSGRTAANFFSQLRGQVLLLFAALSGGKGLKQFANEIVQDSMAIGRVATFLGATTRELSAIQGAVQSAGGSASGAGSTLLGLNNQLQQLSLTGESSVLPYFRALNISITDSNNRIKTAVELLPDLHKAFQGMDAARAQAIGHGIGISDDLLVVLMKSDAEFNKFMEDQQRWGLVTKEQTKAAQDLQYSSTGVSRSFETLGRMILERVAPAFIKFNEWLTKIFVWFQNNPRILEGAIYGIAAAVIALTAAMSAPALGLLGSALGTAATAIGLGTGGGLLAALVALSAGIALVYEDWKTWTEGGQSYFGRFYDAVAHGSHALVAMMKGDNNEMKKNWQSMLDDMKGMYDDFQDNLKKRREKIAEAAKKEGYAGAARETILPSTSPMGRLFNWFSGLMGGPQSSSAQPPAPTTATPSGSAAPSKSTGVRGFIEQHRANAKKVSEETGIPVHRLLGQAGLETGWKTSAPGYNFFGIKAGPSWNGQTQDLITTEDYGNGPVTVTQRFRKYGSEEEAWRDYGRVLMQKNFKSAAEAGISDDEWARRLKAGGYATDPDYAAKVASTAKSVNATMMDMDNKPVPRLSSGNSSSLPPLDYRNLFGAPAATMNSPNVSNDNSRSNVSTTRIGAITVNSQATDANGLARDLKPVLERDSFATQANYNYQ